MKKISIAFLGGGGAMGYMGMIEAIVGGVTGVAQLISGLVRSKEADGLKPPKEDPEERRFLNDITRKRTGYGTGSAVSALTDKINQATSSTKEGVIQTAGGEGGATLASLVRVSKSASSSVNDILSQAEQQSQYFSNMQSALLGKIAQRKLELSMYQYATDKAAGESLIAAGTDNIAGAKGMGASKGGSQVSSQMSSGGTQQAPQTIQTNGVSSMLANRSSAPANTYTEGNPQVGVEMTSADSMPMDITSLF